MSGGGGSVLPPAPSPSPAPPSLLALRADNVTATETTRVETKAGIALVQAKRQEGGNMKFADHAAYITYLKGRAKLQGRLQR